MNTLVEARTSADLFWQESLTLYRETLRNDVAPFWMRHGRDFEFGGISNIVDDQGKVLSHDKYLWSQGRALWTFSALYNRIEKRPEWLDFARQIYEYLARHGRDENGKWMYLLDSQGNVLERDTSIYVDGFVFNGLGEYYAASGNEAALGLALSTAANVAKRLAKPGSYQIAPYEIPAEMKTHGIAMIFSFFFYNLGEIANNAGLKELGLAFAEEILRDFYQSDRNVILEFVNSDGSFSNTPAGRTCVPGHVLEGLWFLIDIFERCGRNERIPQCCDLIKRHVELAWDAKQGGLILALDIQHQIPMYWKQDNCKPWWVQVEALVATAYAYKHTKENWCVEWHQRIQQFAFDHYPVATGEWRQWLDHAGNPMESAALPVKDPFHLPRGLMYLIHLLENQL